jgi:hypothetical protein
MTAPLPLKAGDRVKHTQTGETGVITEYCSIDNTYLVCEDGRYNSWWAHPENLRKLPDKKERI